MCGIAGFLNLAGSHLDSQQRIEVLQSMAGQIAARGPDEQTTFDDGMISIAFNRLAIVGEENGQQPIWNEARTMFVVVNGEVYNHKELRASLSQNHTFKTMSDSEVVLHLFEEKGAGMLDDLHGKFAIVLWDSEGQKLFFARDRLGIKPLYFSKTENYLLFASELKSLLVHPASPRVFLNEKFDLRSDTPTYVSGVKHLAGGTYAFVDMTGEMVLTRYWSVSTHKRTSADDSRNRLVERYGDLLERAVRLRSESSGSLGAFLSGGLDSAALVAIAAKQRPDLVCFNILERNSFAEGDPQAAAELTDALGLQLHSVVFDSNEIADQLDFDLSKLEYFVWLMDSPRFDLEIVYKHELHRYARTVLPDLKVMLLGQGADEFAGGYSRQQTGHPPFESWENYINRRVRSRADREASPNYADSYELEIKSQYQKLQFWNLWHEDRTSSAFGIEARLPFLDQMLIEFLLQIPHEFHCDLFFDKKMIREAARRWLPQRLTNRPKIGFYYTGTKQMSTVYAVLKQILKRTFSAFVHKYADAISPSERFQLTQLYLAAMGWSYSGQVKWGETPAVRALASMNQIIYKTMVEVAAHQVGICDMPRGPSKLSRFSLAGSIQFPEKTAIHNFAGAAKDWEYSVLKG
ncbi:MAG: asparagine synthase (glutamine-hydrolyzing) [Bdellovibrionales bacterium]|nr:asparagine synthase (glutamine-hydrolyzing) [Bdellovibrionales bacterium]